MKHLVNAVIIGCLITSIAAHADDSRWEYSTASGSGWSSSDGWSHSDEWDEHDSDDWEWGGTRDGIPPTVTVFSVPATATSLTVPVSFTATDNVGVTGYLITLSSTPPSASSPAWLASPPKSHTFASTGFKTIYAWARDAAGNVSAGKRAYTFIILDTTRPVVTGFTMPVTSTSLVVPVSTFTATDNVAVTGYLLSESSSTPSAATAGWSASPPTSFTFASSGSKTLYAWARDAAGNVSAYKKAVTVITLPPPGEPVLVISSSSRPFGTYYGEILRAEGFTSFAAKDISAVSPDLLAAHDLVILSEMPLSAAQVAMLEAYVLGGGHLIAMRPDKQLSGLLGLSDSTATLDDGYMAVKSENGPGMGIVGESIQFHGTADRYVLNGATSLANLYLDATTATTHPAVTIRSVGSLGGQAAAFTYDLARSVVYTRQGNPAWAGQERDGISPIRSNDLFYGAASFDPRPDWVDLNKVAIPQADEQQRLLANLILQMNQDKRPLPRFWYLPRGLKAAVVMTGDDHGIEAGGIAARFDDLMAKSAPGCLVDQWECLRGTSYLYANTTLTDLQAITYDAAGFEMAPHVSTGCADWTPVTLEGFYADQLSQWRSVYPSLPAPLTHRTHCIAWSDYTTQPAVERAHGMRLDTNYYFYPPGWVGDRPGLFSGSGLPMRFADANGTPIDVYQAVTQMTDESGQSYPRTIDALLDRALGPEGYFGTFMVNAHTDNFVSEVSDAIVASALQRKVPVISSRQLLTWLDGRNGSTFSSITWNGSLLRFTVQAAQGAHGLSAMVPVPQGKAVNRVTQNGTGVPFTLTTLKGTPHVRFTAATADYEVEFLTDTTPPEPVAFTPGNGTSGVSPLADVTVTMAEPVNSATINASTFELRDPGQNVVPASVSYDETTRSATLRPLAPLALSTTYTAVIKGGSSGVRDLAGNARTADSSWWFTTAPVMPGPLSIWNDAALPGLVDSGPDNPVELGVKFRSDRSGSITGIRFHKAAANTGEHTVHLWSANGALLATATAAVETESGWQRVNFSSPVPITADTVYVASYHAPAGHFSIDYGFFTGKGMDAAPLHALADGASGGNGVFAYGPAGTFPSQGYRGSNYWVDVIFQP